MKKFTVQSRKTHFAIGRKRMERTGELSSQGRAKRITSAPPISSTPPSLFGTARRMA